MNKKSTSTTNTSTKIDVAINKGTNSPSVVISEMKGSNDYKNHKVITKEDSSLYEAKTMKMEKIILK